MGHGKALKQLIKQIRDRSINIMSANVLSFKSMSNILWDGEGDTPGIILDSLWSFDRSHLKCTP